MTAPLLDIRRTYRSADWIAPSTANGCAMACAYCYVPRHKGFSPVVVRDGWLADWAELLDQLDAGIGLAAKAQLAAEVIF